MGSDFRDLLHEHQVDARGVLVLRHTPPEQRLRDMLPMLAVHEPAAYNAYQQTQRERVEKRMKRAAYIASFIGHRPGFALFVGLYDRRGETLRTPQEIRSEPAIQVLEKYGCPAETNSRFWFDLQLRDDFCPGLTGRLEIRWPGKEINWHRFADRAEFTISKIHPDSQLIKLSTQMIRRASAS